MRILFYLLITLFAAGCSQTPTAKQQKKPVQSNHRFAAYFGHVDTTWGQKSIGCTGHLSLLVNDKYVLHIYPNLSPQMDSCTEIAIDSANGDTLTELWIFDDNKASLLNICTDVIWTSAPKPSRKMHARSGKLIIGFNDPVISYANKRYRTSIIVRNLLFIDKKTGEKILLKNELFWKVLDTGTPG